MSFEDIKEDERESSRLDQAELYYYDQLAEAQKTGAPEPNIRAIARQFNVNYKTLWARLKLGKKKPERVVESEISAKFVTVVKEDFDKYLDIAQKLYVRYKPFIESYLASQGTIDGFVSEVMEWFIKKPYIEKDLAFYKSECERKDKLIDKYRAMATPAFMVELKGRLIKNTISKLL
ncbi:MAG: hypothetical protein QXW83_04465, partial [Nitrososphaerales archaeon]